MDISHWCYSATTEVQVRVFEKLAPLRCCAEGSGGTTVQLYVWVVTGLEAI